MANAARNLSFNLPPRKLPVRDAQIKSVRGELAEPRTDWFSVISSRCRSPFDKLRANGILNQRFLSEPQTQGGFILVTAVVLIVVAALVLTAMVFMSATGNLSTARHVSSKEALFIAGTGLERGIRSLISPVLAERVTCAAVSGDANLTNIAFGEGRFTVTGGTPAYSTPAAALKLGITTTDGTIPLNSIAAYAASGGRVLIDRETVDYSKVEAADDALCGGIGWAPCLLGAQRGRDGTTAAAHAVGAPVGQYQCELQSQGGVPDLANVRGKRTLQQEIQLQEGWAIGVNGTILRWSGGPIGNPAWTAAASPVTVELMGISMLSYADGWLVGRVGGGAAQSPLILNWNGNAWVTRNSNLNINEDLFGIHCVSSNDCWAVGSPGNGAAQRPLILHWNGAAWSTNNSNLNINEFLYDVNSVSSTDCWAVGSAGAGASERPLILHRDNTGIWSRRNSNLNIREDLNSIFCVATDDCWAVGTAGNGAARRPLILSWDGSVWSTNNSNLNINENLNSIYCVSSNDCWAVGTRGNGAAQRPLMLHWDGSAWANNNSNLNINEDLNSVYCVTTNDCWAVGAAGGVVTQRPLILHWDGTAWATHNSSLNINQPLMAVETLGARQHPQAAWREVFP